jgi:hypothetical protein
MNARSLAASLSYRAATHRHCSILLKPFDRKLFHPPAVGRRDVENRKRFLSMPCAASVGLSSLAVHGVEREFDRPRSPTFAGIASLVGSKSVTVYVAEIKGRGVAAFHADTGSEAERLVRDRVFRDDLMVLASGGLPLWDGVTDIEVRLARPDEEAKWRASRAKAIRRGNIEANDVGWIAFLVALTDRRNGDRSGREARRSMAARRRASI